MKKQGGKLKWVVIELIDTLWNVNLNAPLNPFTAFLELIDTLWNVNMKTYVSISEKFMN